MFHRRFFSAMDADSCRQVYITYIRPHLEYACQVWDPHLRKYIIALESVSLVDRRKYMKLCTMYKIVHGLTDFPNPPISCRSNPHCLRHLNTYSLEGFRARTNCFTSSYFPSTCTVWNSLTPDLVALPYVSFKRLTKPSYTFTCT